VIAFSSTINRERNCVARAKRCVLNKKLRELRELTIFALTNPNADPQPRTDEAGNIVSLSGEYSRSIKHAGRPLDTYPGPKKRVLDLDRPSKLQPGYRCGAGALLLFLSNAFLRTCRLLSVAVEMLLDLLEIPLWMLIKLRDRREARP
jgi:hypothetical protein